MERKRHSQSFIIVADRSFLLCQSGKVKVNPRVEKCAASKCEQSYLAIFRLPFCSSRKNYFLIEWQLFIIIKRARDVGDPLVSEFTVSLFLWQFLSEIDVQRGRYASGFLINRDEKFHLLLNR